MITGERGELGALESKLHAAILFKCKIIRKKVKIIFLKDIFFTYSFIFNAISFYVAKFYLQKQVFIQKRIIFNKSISVIFFCLQKI